VEGRIGIRIMDPQDEDASIIIFVFLVLSIVGTTMVLYFLFIEFFELTPFGFIRHWLGLL